MNKEKLVNVIDFFNNKPPYDGAEIVVDVNGERYQLKDKVNLVELHEDAENPHTITGYQIELIAEEVEEL